MDRKIILAVSICLILCHASLPAADRHSPSFEWRVEGSTVNPVQAIYDGNNRIAVFEQRTIEQPEENLRYFNSVPKPPVLRNLVLTPGGKPLVEGVQLYWVLKWRSVVTDRLVDIKAEGNGSERLTVTFVTEDEFRIALSKRILTLTYDAEKEGYVYDFLAILEFRDPEFFREKPMVFEFSDPWYAGCPGPAVEFPGMWKRRYQRFAYEAEDGGIYSIPMNHYTTSHKSNIRLKPDGLFVALYEPDGNPAFQFMGGTAKSSNIAICWWGYDVHFNRPVEPREMDAPIETHFRIFQCPDDRARELRDRAVMRPLGAGEMKGRAEYPVYERTSSFTKGLRTDEIWNGPLDPFPWDFTGDGAVWDKSVGRNDTYSMKIERAESGVTRWWTNRGDGQGYWMDPWTPCRGYKVNCWVRTENVTGNGAALALQYHIPNEDQRYPIVTSRKLTGTNGWTKVEAEIGNPPPEAGCLMIMLQQDGSGTSWFDDLEVVYEK